MKFLTFLGGWLDTNLAVDPVLFNPFQSIVNAISKWIDAKLNMHLSFDGDLMTPDWCEGDGDPVLRPERKPATLTPIAAHVERLKGKQK